MERSWEDRWPDLERLLDQALDSSPGERVALVELTRSKDPGWRPRSSACSMPTRQRPASSTEPAAVYAAPLLAWAAESDPVEPGARPRPLRGGASPGTGRHGNRIPGARRQASPRGGGQGAAPELAAAIGPERFLREIEIAATLHHPHILPLFDSGALDALLYYVMPHVEGESLRAALATGRAAARRRRGADRARSGRWRSTTPTGAA